MNEESSEIFSPIKSLIKKLTSYFNKRIIFLPSFPLQMISFEIYTSALASLSCFWIIFKYFQQPKNNIGLLLIFVLAIADLIFSLGIFISNFIYLFDTWDIILILSMEFSIMWASAVAYIVYKSLQDKHFNLPKVFWSTILVIIILSAASTI